MSAQGWQPITTAPSDGTPFFVWADGYEWPEVIRWYPHDEETVEECGEAGYFSYAEELLADACDWEHEVTHWMPLPAAPVSA